MPSNSEVLARLSTQFNAAFGGTATLIVRAPGRVNLIGEHTDYNDGFVMPMAIDRAVWIAARPRADRQVRLYAANYERSDQFALDQITKADGDHAWSNYVRGVAAILLGAGYDLSGMDAVLWGDVPVGAGLSSSAAVEVASALVFAELSGKRIAPAEMARLAQRAEVEFVGVNCGIMDQLISALGREGEAVLIDCRSLETRGVPLPADAAIVVADTMKRRALVDSHYNTRRAECEEGARLLGARSLRDVTPAELARREAQLPETIRKRCRHVVGENGRVLECAEALARGDLAHAGQLLNRSHQSLRDDYAVSCAELDLMVELAVEMPGVYGARMTGAGFGGCTLSLVEAGEAERMVRELGSAYSRRIGIEAHIHVCRATAGAEIIEKLAGNIPTGPLDKPNSL